MPQTISKNEDTQTQVIAGAFSDPNKASEVVQEFRKLGYLGNNLQIFSKDVSEPHYVVVMDEVVAISQRVYYAQAIEDGKTVVVVSGVMDPQPVIDLFDRYGAEYNPDGSRNLRDDVAGMTLGAVVGAVALGAVGGLVAGPIGLAAGIPAGALAGGAAGAAAGTSAEHKK